MCLERLEELKGVEDHGETIRIGAGTTLTHLLRSDVIGRELPILTKSLSVLGSRPIRNMATIGGNICTASPGGDTLPPLYVLDAELELETSGARRRIKIREFITGRGTTRLLPSEILVSIHVPKPRAFSVQHFEKVGLRNALACAAVSFAALLNLSDSGSVLSARLAWGAVAPAVFESEAVVQYVLGRDLSLESLAAASELVRRAVSPISDVRAPEDYRRQVAGNMLLRLAVFNNHPGGGAR